MKKISFALLLAVLVSCVFAACSDAKYEKKLDGQWSGRTSFTDHDGDAATMTMTLDLTASSHRMRMTLGYVVPDMGEVCRVKISGTWKAASETLWLDIDEDTMSFEYDSMIEYGCEAMGLSLRDIKRQIEHEMRQELSGMDCYDIKKLTANSLVLDMEDGVEINLKRR
ncbi:MAG: hypothetical protein K2F74_04210 [Muribaculaceae bacterium]|nr:hypothetical protein [Muribaculaceae bacterium]